MSLMVTGCHRVSMPPHNCSSKVTPIFRQQSPVRLFKILTHSYLQRRERSVPGAGPGPLGRPRLRERAQVRRRHRHGE